MRTTGKGLLFAAVFFVGSFYEPEASDILDLWQWIASPAEVASLD